MIYTLEKKNSAGVVERAVEIQPKLYAVQKIRNAPFFQQLFYFKLHAGFKIFQQLFYFQLLVFRFFNNFFAFNYFQIFKQLFLLLTAGLQIFQQLFCFQLFSNLSVTFLLSSAGFQIFNNFFAFNFWFSVFLATFCFQS